MSLYCNFRIVGIPCHLWICTHLSQWAILDRDDRTKVNWEKRSLWNRNNLQPNFEERTWWKTKQTFYLVMKIIPQAGWRDVGGDWTRKTTRKKHTHVQNKHSETILPFWLHTSCVSSSQWFTHGSPAREVPQGYQLILSPLCPNIHKRLSNL